MLEMKKILRQSTLSTLVTLVAEEKRQIENDLYDNLYRTSLWQTASVIGITYPQENEWNTIPIMQRAWEEGKCVSIPKVEVSSKTMIFYQINHEGDVERGAYNIFEPKSNLQPLMKNDIDLLFVPGLVFDQEGFRIGYGGGYYDRFLTDYQHQTVSLVSKLQLVNEVPYEAHDIPVQYYILEDGVMKI